MREIRVVGPTELAVTETDAPVPGPGEVLVRNRYFTVLAALRTLLAGGVPGAPLPAATPGSRWSVRCPGSWSTPGQLRPSRGDHAIRDDQAIREHAPQPSDAHRPPPVPRSCG